MSRTVKLLVPMDIDVELFQRQRRVLEHAYGAARSREDHEEADLIDGIVNILDAIADEVQP